jgi:mannose-1-phosphate guanylyltransferase
MRLWSVPRKIVSTQFIWSDLGSLNRFYDYLKTIGHRVDKHGNMVIGTNNFTAFVCSRYHLCTPTANFILQKNIRRM